MLWLRDGWKLKIRQISYANKWVDGFAALWFNIGRCYASIIYNNAFIFDSCNVFFIKDTELIVLN